MKRLALLALAITLLADPTRAQESVELRGATTLVGSQATVLRVRVPQQATLMFNPMTDIEGDGDFVGFALSKYPVVLDSVPGITPFPRGGSVLVYGRAAGLIPYESTFNEPQIEAGEYLIYLLADGSPVRVTFHLSGLVGALELAPAYPVRFDARVLAPRVTIEAERVIYSAGAGGDVFGPGLGLVMLWLRGQSVADMYPPAPQAYGSCLYQGDPPDETVAYLPGCPFVTQSQYLLVANGVGFDLDLAALGHLYAGRWGQGVYYLTAGLVDTSGSAAFWLTLDTPETPTPTLVHPASVESEPGRVKITWFTSEPGRTATVYRNASGAEWLAFGAVNGDGTGRLVFEDRDAAAGSRLGYRLGFAGPGGEQLLGEVWVDVPGRPALALEGLLPNPARGHPVVHFSLPSAGSAQIELLDLTGRRILRREVGELGAGRHELSLEPVRALPAGIYVLRLTQGARSISAKAIVAR